MKNSLIVLSICFSTLWSNSVFSYYKEKIGSNLSATSDKPNKPTNTKAAQCAPATAKYYMKFNDVSALIENGGSMFQNRQGTRSAAYEVPKGSNRFAIYSGSLWMGGTDINNQLKLAALTFRDGNDFWAGPLSATQGSGNYNGTQPVGYTSIRDFGSATTTADICLAYDHFDTITKALVLKYNNWWECNNQGQAGVPFHELAECKEYDIDPLTTSELNQIKNWPAHGDASLFQDHYLAPFYDRNGNTWYEPELGDYPWYDDIVTGRDDIQCGNDRRISLYGDATCWWVFNDKGNIHTETQGDPIGMEIRAQAFAFSTSDEVNRMTFYNYDLINRGTQTLYNTYFSQFLDPDLGYYKDDYVGCDVSRGLGYAYNGDNDDEDDGGKFGYGKNPPAIGVDFFEGPYLDPDNIDNKVYDVSNSSNPVQDALDSNGIVYKGIGIGYSDGIVDNERFGMRRFSYFTGGATTAPFSDPTTAAQYYNFMKGNWSNGTPMTYDNANGQNSSATKSSYMFPGDSDPLGWATQGAIVNGDWTEATGANTAGDRRFVQSAGPFTLKPGAFNNITVGVIYGRGSDGNAFSSVVALKRADTKAQALFDNCFQIMDPPMAPKLTIQELENELVLMLDNPSSSNNYKEKYNVADKIGIPFDTLEDGTVIDKFYKFEGYQIYQLKDVSNSVADINNTEKARLVAQCDIKNGISRIINFEFDESLSQSIPTEKVFGNNSGIKHSFKVTEDLFASGVTKLVNNKTYYYVAIAYAYNQYRKYDPNDKLLLDGQKTPYISSRLGYNGAAIKSISAVPHNPSFEADGTKMLTSYGLTPEIKRIDGTGNGNRNLELTTSSINSILTNGYLQEPVYKIGNGPINVKVIDPLNVVDGYFELKYRKYNSTSSFPNFNSADTASWVVYRFDKEGGTVIDSIVSNANITMDDEQLIPEWGLSIQIKQNKYTSGASISDYVTTPITSSIYYSDSTHRWLTNVVDDASYYPTNWIRSGVYTPTATDSNSALKYRNPWYYFDAVGLDNDKRFTKIAGGLFAPHRLVGYEYDYMPLAYYNTTSPGSSRTNASISFSPSIDIVLTNDKSKWTRCPVIELGRNSALTVGNAKAGGLRKSQSVGKDGLPDGTGDGMGWFPGYAIDIESGARLYLAFGENSFLQADNGGDMIWNPSNRYTDNAGNPVFGGQHPIYVFNYKTATVNGSSSFQDLGAYDENNNELFNTITTMINTNSNSARNKFYSNLSWVGNPMLVNGQDVLSSDVTIKIRVNKEYKNYSATGLNGGKPMYSWNTSNIATIKGDSQVLTDVLDLINVVPNPYYAYSQYERNRVDTRVKITNLPEKCTVRIYSVNGKLMRTFKKDSPITSLDWDLNNQIGVAVASGVYLIHVEVPGIGERVIKFFGGMRQVDLHGI